MTTQHFQAVAQPRRMYHPLVTRRAADPWRALREAIRAERKLRHWSQERLAAEAKISRPALSNLENGTTVDPTQPTLEAIALALGWDRERLARMVAGATAAAAPSSPPEPLSREALALAKRVLPRAGPAELELFARYVAEIDRLSDAVEALQQEFGNEH